MSFKNSGLPNNIPITGMITYGTFVVFDFDITYSYRPNSDVYQEILPKELIITIQVPSNFSILTFEEQKSILKDAVISSLADEVLFDTPDEPDFAIEDVDFCFEIKTD